MPSAADVLAREAALLVERLRLWTPQRWVAAAPPYGTRADLVHHLAAWFVAQAQETDRELPRHDSDLALPDQLAVTADDLRRARPDRATAACAHLLLHRSELLGDGIPSALRVELGNLDLQALGQLACIG